MKIKTDAYELIKQEELDNIRSMGYLFRHKKTGARVAVVSNDDENKVFHIAFRTPPSDSTGIPHILEHSVLCGSRKFPSKDPFVELVKGSLNTFLNAMTYPDKTMYPIASCNDQDFKNLMDVYLDAVFYPNIYRKEEIFRQEGWSYQLEDAEGELSYNGVVYNEMKGAFSSPEDVLDREIINSLFPDTPYANESGGDPACIPDLSYEDFLAFHQKYYHPSNSFVYLYGNMDVEERLGFLDREYLSHFEAKEIHSEIPLQKPFSEMRTVRKQYSISQSDSLTENTYLSYNAAIGTSLDTVMANAFAVIEYALLSAPGAPLKQALLDAGIGKDIMGSYDSGTYQPIFSITAKFSEADRSEKFLAIIRQELTRIVQEGLDEKALRAGINYMEFRYREADFGNFPKGLMYGIDMMDTWLYDDDCPFGYLKQLDAFEILKEKVGTSYYTDLIKKWLLDNPHATLVIVEPKKGLSDEIEEETRRKLDAYKAGLSQEEIGELVEKTKKLRAFQETPSTREELLAIPTLSREDIRKETLELRNEEHKVGDSVLLHQDYFTNGIAYVDLMFDMKYVPKEDVPYVGLLKAVLGMMGTEHYSYGELFNEINMQTGGIFPAVTIFQNNKKSDRHLSIFAIKAKTLYEKLPFAFEMMEEILFHTDFSDTKRLAELISEQKSKLQMRLTSSGHTTAIVRGMAYFSEIYAYSDAVTGIGYYKLIEELDETFEEKKEEVVRRLQNLCRLIFRKDTFIGSVTAEQEGFEKVYPLTENLLGKLPGEPLDVPSYTMVLGRKNEGFLTSSKVQYVARCGNFRASGLKYTGALKILKLILSYEYLWVNIRVKGGAYGCMSGFGHMGDSYFVSYRDPNLGATNQVYEGIADYVRNFDVDDRDMTKYVIGTMSELDTPLTPRALGARAMTAWMSDSTVEDFQRERDEILSATQEDIRKLAPIVEAILKDGSLCVIGGEDRLKKEKELFKELKPLIGEETNS